MSFPGADYANSPDACSPEPLDIGRKKSKNLITTLRDLKRRYSVSQQDEHNFDSPLNTMDPTPSTNQHDKRNQCIEPPGAPRPVRKAEVAPQTVSLQQKDPSRDTLPENRRASLLKKTAFATNPDSNSPRKVKRVSLIPPSLTRSSSNATKSSIRYAGAPRLSLVHVPEDSDEETHSEMSASQEFPIEPRIIKSVAEHNKPRGSIATIEPLKCRICYLEQGEDADEEPLISPCRCKGTVGLLHASCLQEWLVTANSTKCELCGYQYIMKRSRFSSRRRNTIVQHASAFKMWINSRLARRHIIGDVACTILLAIGTFITAYFCIMGAIHFHNSVNPYAWQIFGLVALAITLVVCFLLWTVLAVKHHYGEYKDARRQRLELIQLERQKQFSEDLRNCTILPRPRGSSQLISPAFIKKEETSLLMGLRPVGVGFHAREDVLEPVQETSELSMSVCHEEATEDEPCNNNDHGTNYGHCLCSPSHHTRNNISIRSTDIIL